MYIQKCLGSKSFKENITTYSTVSDLGMIRVFNHSQVPAFSIVNNIVSNFNITGIVNKNALVSGFSYCIASDLNISRSIIKINTLCRNSPGIACTLRGTQTVCNNVADNFSVRL